MLPRAMYLALAITTALYVAVSLVMQGVAMAVHQIAQQSEPVVPR